MSANASGLGAVAGDLHAPIENHKRRLTAAELSQIINFGRISLIIGLVFLHYGRYPNAPISPFSGIDSSHQIATFVNSFMLFFFFSVVPLLSMVSGWLFFSFERNAASELASRIWRRFKSLYIPLVAWNALYLVLMWALFEANSAHPLLTELNIDLTTARPTQYINAIFAITQHPIAFQFWFVRDLFVTVLVSPLLWLLLKRVPYYGAGMLTLVWLSGIDLPIFFRTDVLLFFYLGGLLRLQKMPLEIGTKVATWLLVSYALLVALRTLSPYFIDDNTAIVEIATKSMRLLGVLACWGLFQRIAFSPLGLSLSRYAGFAFFLHAAHFPLIAQLKIVLWHLVPDETEPWMVAHYFASVFLTVALALGIGVVAARFAPRQFALLNGGRAGA